MNLFLGLNGEQHLFSFLFCTLSTSSKVAQPTMVTSHVLCCVLFRVMINSSALSTQHIVPTQFSDMSIALAVIPHYWFVLHCIYLGVLLFPRIIQVVRYAFFPTCHNKSFYLGGPCLDKVCWLLVNDAVSLLEVVFELFCVVDIKPCMYIMPLL